MKKIKLDASMDQTVLVLKTVLRSGTGDGSAMAAHGSINNGSDLFGRVQTLRGKTTFKASKGFNAFTSLKGTLREEGKQTIIDIELSGPPPLPFLIISIIALAIALALNGGFDPLTLLKGSPTLFSLIAIGTFCAAGLFGAQRYLLYDGLKYALKKRIRYQHKQHDCSGDIIL